MGIAACGNICMVIRMRLFALIVCLMLPSWGSAAEKIYESLKNDIKAFHCNKQVEEHPYIFIRTTDGWTFPLMDMLDPSKAALDYEIDERSDEKFFVKAINSDAHQIYFNLKDGNWSRTTVTDGEAKEHRCDDVSTMVALIATSILPQKKRISTRP